MIKSSILRILHNGKISGTGFFVAEDLVVTCAHVVAGLGESVQVQITGYDDIFSAQVIPEFYRDADEDDICFLRLESLPKKVIPLRLGAAEHSLPGSQFQAFGYPNVGTVNGVYADGQIHGVVAEGDRHLLQLNSTELTVGHSGAPVWDMKRGVVVGMVVSVNKPDVYGRLRDTAFAIPSEALWEVCEEIRPSETPPYFGLESFSDETEQFFFGREVLTEKLSGLLRGGCRFLAVIGPSGSGKSSVVRAGLLASLKKGRLPGSLKWAQITMRPANDPFAQMKTAGLDPIDIDGYLTSHPEMERIVLFIDQFEELFTLCTDETCNRFARELSAALESSKLVLIMTMREDFVTAFNAKAAPLAASDHLKIELVPNHLKRVDLVAMIERPADEVNLVLEEGLTERILKDLTRDDQAHSSMLPLLEFTLTRLWEERRDGQLTHDAYQSAGGVTGSLAIWADDAYIKLSDSDRLLAQSLLTSLVHLGEEEQGIPDTRRRCTWSELGTSESIQRVIRHFADRRLIITDDEVIELVHDAMITEWSRLQDWIQKDRNHLMMRQAVSEAARDWEGSGRDPNLLTHRGTRLKQAIEMMNIPKYQLGGVEQTYLGVCKKAEGKEKNFRRLAIAAFVGIPLLILGSLMWPYLTRERAIPGDWVTIPAGSFVMGMDQAEAQYAEKICLDNALDPSRCYLWETLRDESGRQKNTELDKFDMMDNEVTNAQYRQCKDDGACKPPSTWKYDKIDVNVPATNLNWYHAKEYCAWLGGRLPTEGEWEKAARGPGGYTFSWGNVWDPAKANLKHLGDGPVQSISQKESSDISGYGIKNLAGNVREWTVSEWSPLPLGKSFENTILNMDTTDQPWPVVVRGGSWMNEPSEGMASKRGRDSVLSERLNLGFRCVCPDDQKCDSPWTGRWVWFGKY